MTYPKSREEVTGKMKRAGINSQHTVSELGEVEIIMSDKTGTLTKNQLNLVAICADASVTYPSRDESTKDQSIGEYLLDKTDFIKCIFLCHGCAKKSAQKDQKQAQVLTGANLDELAILRGLEEAKACQLAQRAHNSISIIDEKEGHELFNTI